MWKRASVFCGVWLIMGVVFAREQAEDVSGRQRMEPVWRMAGNPGGPVHGVLRSGAVLDGRSAWAVTAPDANGIEADYVLTEDRAWVGDWTEASSGSGIRRLRFRFYAGAGGEVDFPAGLTICIMRRVGDDNHVWKRTVSPSELTSGWNQVTVGIEPGRPGQWWSPTRTEDQWAEDIASVGAVGLWLAYQSGGQYAAQTYGISDFALE